MKSYVSKIRYATVMIGILGAHCIASSAFAQEQIRLNPEYKQHSILNSDEIITENMQDDFNQFLNPSEETEQYVLLTEPENRKAPIIALGEANKRMVPLLQFNQRYQYSPSLSFNMPALASSLDGGSGAGNVAGSLGGSQLVLSLNPSREASNPFNPRSSVNLVLGSSFIKSSLNRYTSFLNNGLLTPQAYNLSLGLGYSGFQVGASYSRNDYLFSSDLSGFDLGFGYSGASWSANVRIGEYNRNRALLLSEDYNIFDSVSAYELGAAYRLFSNVNLTGRFTYYSYGLGSDVVPLEDVKSLIFGTNLSF
ncbi:MAG: hypothetical protein HOJ34_06905 [Kordiimonadaceae bacterium]|nr:hypothetical protein [Kordiimonadaceae bacterium]MBT6035795.1 hypothetical protein [Kordiimonadaceae bacterium]MBT6329497.1 hypothetical protein [Kordiimonadaceae bacterium]MBT7581635.1 hypothetical protein [Kordiimonadaceae bacterium]